MSENIDLTPYIESIIKDYNDAIYSMSNAKPGEIRGKKGKLVEAMVVKMVNIAWTIVLAQEGDRLKQDKEKKSLKIVNRDEYVARLTSEKMRKKIEDNFSDIVYKFGTDNHVKIDEKIVLAIECKSYTESAMLKRIIFDSILMTEVAENAKYILFQLESALSGDFHDFSDEQFGSAQYHVLMSRNKFNIDVITMLEGKRDEKHPIHKYPKKLTPERVKYAINVFANYLKEYC